MVQVCLQEPPQAYPLHRRTARRPWAGVPPPARARRPCQGQPVPAQTALTATPSRPASRLSRRAPPRALQVPGTLITRAAPAPQPVSLHASHSLVLGAVKLVGDNAMSSSSALLCWRPCALLACFPSWRALSCVAGSVAGSVRLHARLGLMSITATDSGARPSPSAFTKAPPGPARQLSGGPGFAGSLSGTGSGQLGRAGSSGFLPPLRLSSGSMQPASSEGILQPNTCC